MLGLEQKKTNHIFSTCLSAYGGKWERETRAMFFSLQNNQSSEIHGLISTFQNNGAQQLASEATVYIMLEDVNDEIPLFTEREQETVLEGEPIGTKVTQVNAIDKDGTFPNNQVSRLAK